MKIYLIRHGQTDWNVLGKIQGRKDTSLNAAGLCQAQLTAKEMNSHPVTQIFTSVQKRAALTALTIGERQKAAVLTVEGLEEVDFGIWEGMTWEEIQHSYPKEYECWLVNPVEVAPPGGETQLHVLERCARAIETILAQAKGDFAVVSHGATLAHIITYLVKGQLEKEVVVENASITTIEYSPLNRDFHIIKINDTSHLEAGE